MRDKLFVFNNEHQRLSYYYLQLNLSTSNEKIWRYEILFPVIYFSERTIVPLVWLLENLSL